MFFDGALYLVTGPSVWNALALGSTTVANVQLVYNLRRTGVVELAGRRFELRRVRFPRRGVRPEYYVVDLFENADVAGVEYDILTVNLSKAMANRRFDASRLQDAALEYGSKRTQRAVSQAVGA